MNKDTALRLALEALSTSMYPQPRQLNAIAAIKAALEEKDEPWEKFCDSNCVWTDHHPDCKLSNDAPVAYCHECVTYNGHHDGCSYAASPAKQQDLNQPVAWQWLTTSNFRKKLPKDAEKSAWNPLYATPPAQEFVCSTGLCRFTLTQTNVGIGERGMEAYEAAKKRGWVGVSDERLMEMPQQEPVALEAVYETIIDWDEGGGKRSRRELARRIVALYTTPPQRKPLTDEQIEAIAKEHIAVGTRSFQEFARRIEAAHGIKGEA